MLAVSSSTGGNVAIRGRMLLASIVELKHLTMRLLLNMTIAQVREVRGVREGKERGLGEEVKNTGITMAQRN
jgi:hypothetical protein